MLIPANTNPSVPVILNVNVIEDVSVVSGSFEMDGFAKALVTSSAENVDEFNFSPDREVALVYKYVTKSVLSNFVLAEVK